MSSFVEELGKNIEMENENVEPQKTEDNKIEAKVPSPPIKQELIQK
jgi:hypothetical protein